MSNFSLKSFHFYTLKPEPYKVMGEGHKSVEMRLNVDETVRKILTTDYVKNKLAEIGKEFKL